MLTDLCFRLDRFLRGGVRSRFSGGVARWRNIAPATLCGVFLVAINGCFIPFGTARFEIEGVVLDSETQEPLTGPTVIIRALPCVDCDEFGRGAATVVDGRFFAIVPTLAEASTDFLEVTVTRQDCETVFLLVVRNDVTFVDRGFLRSSIERITDPILVPACENDGAEGAGG